MNKLKSILVCIFSLVGIKGWAKENRDNIVLTNIKNIQLNQVENFLNDKGIILDENSEVSVYEENNYIDIYVFNGIINEVNSDTYVSSSRNERT